MRLRKDGIDSMARVNAARDIFADLDPVVVLIEAKLRRAGKGKRLVIENGAEAEVNAGLAAMITEAFAIRKQRCLDRTTASRQ